jgi:hypothetical protein
MLQVQSLDVHVLVAQLVGAIQSQAVQIQQQAEQNKEQTAQIKELQSQMKALRNGHA